MSFDLFGAGNPEDDLKELSRLDPAHSGDRERFVETVLTFYSRAGRRMPWRDNPDPYWVFVSEIMLQQTQVSRVMQKFPVFVHRFPGFRELAEAPLAEVLGEWSGLGYNRRARWMKEAAGLVLSRHAGVLPELPETLVGLPGIGPNTAGSIAAFAYNRPAVFIETNIRRVLLHVFFPDTPAVHDRELLPILSTCLPEGQARVWYWALMDYGVALARSVGNANRRSRHYSRQSAFEGSTRQLRGRILRLLGEQGALSVAELADNAGFPEERTRSVLEALKKDGMVQASRQRPDRWIIAD